MLLRLIYRLLLILVTPIFLIGLYKSKPNKPKFGKRWKEHFGITSQQFCTLFSKTVSNRAETLYLNNYIVI